MNFLFFNLLNDGGPIFMYPMLLMLISCIVLIIKIFLKEDKSGKLTSLIKHVSLLALVFGFLGFMLGMINAFDAISRAGNISHEILAAGLKIALITPTFGMVVFLMARLGLIGLTLKEK